MQQSQHEYVQVPTFDYSSPFTYRSLYDDDFHSTREFESLAHDRHQQDRGLVERFIYNFLVSVSFVVCILTFPISSWMCIKRIPSLQRCLTYRLGQRLPLKGPGFVLKLPFIDTISIVDLIEQTFMVVEKDEQILTSEGSIVQMRPCEATLQVLDAVRTKTSLTQSVDVKECLRLRLCNLLRSKHVEDLERKMQYIVHAYEDDSNRFLKKWGYAIKLKQLPTFVVMERADPMSSIKKQIEQVFSPGDAEQGPENAIKKMFGMPTQSSQSQKQSKNPAQNPESSPPLTATELASGEEILREIIHSYRQYLMFHSQICIELTVGSVVQHFYSYEKSTNTILRLEYPPTSIDFMVEFANCDDYRRFLTTRDMNLVKYSLK